MSIFSIDYESTSLCPIKLGTYRYACDPSTRILMFAIARDAEDPLVWRFDEPQSNESLRAAEMFSGAIGSQSLLYAQNAAFELAVSHYRLAADVGITQPIDINSWRCTQAMCRRAAIPESLGAAAAFLGLPEQKADIGKALIAVFSDQNKVVTLEAPEGSIDPDTITESKTGKLSKGKKPKSIKSASPILESPIPWDWQLKVAGQKMTVRQAWETFIEYCAQDVRTERELHKKLGRFELTGGELASFQFDMRMNFRGVPVNRVALDNAQRVITEYQERLEARMQRMCGLRSGQGAKLLAWLKERGYTEDDLQADTVETFLQSPGDMEGLALEVLRHRALLSFAAIKKLPAMSASACPDGRVRGTTLWHGARTGRATGRIIQPQNMKKATIGDSALAYAMICDNADLDEFEMLWASPLEVMSSCCRHFMQRPSGMMLDSDFVGVEARLTCFLVGDTEKTASILSGVDQYKATAVHLFGVPYEEVTKAQRTIAKPVELGCCYGVGGRGLMTSLAGAPYNISRTLAECKGYVDAYRAAHPKTVAAWRELEDAAKAAIRTGAAQSALEGKVAFGCIQTAGIKYLIMRLPSGRRLYYPKPEIKATFRRYEEEDMVLEPWKREKGGYWSDSIRFWGKAEQTWCWIHTFGSRLLENLCQACGVDLLNHGCIEAEKAGYPIIMIVHDQALAEDTGLPLEGFEEALCRKQPWAEDFALEAESAIIPYYLKD